eukprot:TRINITY_DN14054_c0_g2_i1.p1 TRINITY_DN14054_c0_g2~~TRINITY_DN14054_c0_g2_i1.p1  ORF type:complete len:528 (+),score=126.48 TRINITY_DN14054_c0_g2_i1:72-1586(+)
MGPLPPQGAGGGGASGSPAALRPALLCTAECGLVGALYLWCLLDSARTRPLLLLAAVSAAAHCVPSSPGGPCRPGASSGVLLGCALLPLLFAGRTGPAHATAFYVAWLTGLGIAALRLLSVPRLRLAVAAGAGLLLWRLSAHPVAPQAAPPAAVGICASVVMLRSIRGSLTRGECAVLAQLLAIQCALVHGHLLGTVRLTKLRVAIVVGSFGAVLVATAVMTLGALRPPPAAQGGVVALGAAGVLGWMSAALGMNSLVWLWGYLTARTAVPLRFVAYYALVLVLGLLAAPQRFSAERRTIARKWFHLVAVVMFVPTILLHLRFMSLAFAVALAVFLVVEALRMAEAGAFAAAVDGAMRRYVDDRDEGRAILTHLHLLLGCALPVWYSFFAHQGGLFSSRALLSAFSGVAVTGVGDAAASIVGSSLGRWRWPGSRKTIEGTTAMIASVLAFQLLMLYIKGFHNLAADSVARLLAGDVLVCLLEAATDQVDNLVLPLYHLILLQRL